MDDRLITLPDSDFVKEFSQIKTEEDSSPDQLYVDGHIDLPYFMSNHTPDKIFDNLEEGPVTPETVRQSGVRLFNTAIYCEDKFNGENSLTHFQKNFDYANKILENVKNVESQNDIEELKRTKDAIVTIFLLENADVLADNNKLTLSLRDKDIYIVGLTHAGTNRLADGNGIQFSDGITPAGREVIRVLIENNILIDVAHLHPSCFWQLTDLIETHCVSSHTGIRERCNIPRNLDMEQVKQIFEREGLVGITFNPDMLSPDGEADIEDIFVHLDTVVQKYGPDFVGIGSDFCGFDTLTRGMEDITGIRDLIKLMSSRGYERNDIDKIMGLNWLRLYEKIL